MADENPGLGVAWVLALLVLGFVLFSQCRAPGAACPQGASTCATPAPSPR